MKAFFKRVWAGRFILRHLPDETLITIRRREAELKELIEQNNDGIKRVGDSFKYTAGVLDKLKSNSRISEDE